MKLPLSFMEDTSWRTAGESAASPSVQTPAIASSSPAFAREITTLEGKEGVTLREPITNEETNRLHGNDALSAEERRESRGYRKTLEKRGTRVFGNAGKAFHDGENGVSERRTRLAGIRAMLPTERTKEGNEETGGSWLKSRGDERLKEGIHAGTVHGGEGEIELAQLAPFPPMCGVDPLGGRFPREVNRCVAVHQHVRNHGSLDETPFSKVPDFPPKWTGWRILPPSAPVRR